MNERLLVSSIVLDHGSSTARLGKSAVQVHSGHLHQPGGAGLANPRPILLSAGTGGNFTACYKDHGAAVGFTEMIEA